MYVYLKANEIPRRKEEILYRHFNIHFISFSGHFNVKQLNP